MLERYPDNVPAVNNLALAYRNLHQFATAESLFRRGAAMDSTVANVYFGQHATEVLQGHFVDSRRTLDVIARRFPGNPLLLNVEMQDAAAQQRWDLAERHARAKIAEAGSDTLQLVDPVEALAGLAMTQGRFTEAERLWRQQLTLSRVAESMGRHLFGILQLGYLELRYRNRPDRAVALVDSALARTPLDSLLRGDRRYDELARFFVAAGQPRRARVLMDAAIENDRILGRVLKGERSWTRGAIALAEGRAADAERELRSAAELHDCTICVLPELGRAYEAAGRPAEAVRAYER